MQQFKNILQFKYRSTQNVHDVSDHIEKSASLMLTDLAYMYVPPLHRRH